MSMTDPIADMLTRIRNAARNRCEMCDVPASNLKIRIAEVLRDEGYIEGFKLYRDGRQGILRVLLKYTPDGDSVILGLQRVSKPGRRMYKSHDEIPLVLSGLGSAIVSTSKGVMTDRRAREQGVGGEVLCRVW